VSTALELDSKIRQGQGLMSSKHGQRSQVLVKQNLATQLREEILAGKIAAGAKIVEGTWARHFGVAQSSVREALNILIAEGFVTKGHGRSARVLNLSKQDIIYLYQLRGVLEGLAARLLSEQKVPLIDVEAALLEIRSAVQADNVRQIIESMQRFHMTLLEKTGNPFLVEEGRRLIIPLYDFTLMRALTGGLDGSPWRLNLERHRQILDAIRTGPPYFAEQTVIHVMDQFLKAALHVWADKIQSVPPAASAKNFRAPSKRNGKNAPHVPMVTEPDPGSR
jgi:DNA-binding GntR family transcriptional regulator